MLFSLVLCFVAFTVQNVVAWKGIALVGNQGEDGQVYMPGKSASIKADNFG